MNRSKLNFGERLYLFEVFKGLWLTSQHFFSNMNKHLARQLGFTRIEKGAVTFQYPEERRPFSPRYRSRHRLTTREGRLTTLRGLHDVRNRLPGQVHLHRGG